MKLRWFSTCDENGRWSEPSLQVWDKESHQWEDIPCVTCKTWEEQRYLADENADFTN